jgi:hypothetical protein
LAIRYIPGGRKVFLEHVKYAVLNNDPSAMAFWAVYSNLAGRGQRFCNFDDVCVAAGLQPDVLMSAIIGHSMRMKADVSDLVQATLQPQVIQAWGKSAVRISGAHAEIAQKDRTMFLQSAGLVAVPKGASIHLHANATANSQAASAAAAHPSVPSFLDDVDLENTTQRAIDGQTIPSDE